MGVLGVGVEAAGAALQRVADSMSMPPPRTPAARRDNAITRGIRTRFSNVVFSASADPPCAAPGLTPLTETSARSPPLVAGSIVTLAVMVPAGVCSQYSPWRQGSRCRDRSDDDRLPLRLGTVALTMPLSSVQLSPLSVRVTGLLTVTLATFGRKGGLLRGCAGCRTTARARNVDTKEGACFGHDANLSKGALAGDVSDGKESPLNRPELYRSIGIPSFAAASAGSSPFSGAPPHRHCRYGLLPGGIALLV